MFLIIKYFDIKNVNVTKYNAILNYVDILKEYKIITDRTKLILFYKNKFIWIKQITIADFSIIDYVLSEFFDDEIYCQFILKQFFETKAKDISKLN